uniref:Cadherin related family member 3 n=1 Tax=Sphenodon punctatus TaxID=8508 RepID=A0A8D0HQ36_SPHPU
PHPQVLMLLLLVALNFNGLPGIGIVLENSLANVLVFTFNVTLSPTSSISIPLGYPYIINSNPLTRLCVVFQVVTTGNPVLDYETMPHSFELQIYVQDTEGESDLQILTVEIAPVSEPPVFLGNMASQLQPLLCFTFWLVSNNLCHLPVWEGENASVSFLHCRTQRNYKIPEEQIPGTVVANITAKDPDDDGYINPDGYINSLIYSISPPNEHFSIDSRTGMIQVATRINRDDNSRRQHPNISLVIFVQDLPRYGRMTSIEITVTIEDLNDNPPECNNYAIPETSPPGTVFRDLRNSCKDIDAELPNNQFNFTGLSGLGSNIFVLEPPGSGRIVVKNIYVYIRIIPVNEFSPVFTSSPYVFNVSEIIARESNIGKVSATDKDFPATGITYSIAAGGNTQEYSNIFWIDPTEGTVAVIGRLDYETTQRYNLAVQASDNDGRISTVIINIFEVNDEKPVCSPNSYSLAIPVDLPVGTNIESFKLECVDRDSSPRSFRYTINSGNVRNHFTFSPSAGSNASRLILASPFDYSGGLDTTWDYRLLVYITDDNLLLSRNTATALIQTGTVTLTIQVIPNPTTTITTTPGVTHLIQTKNVYSASAWYIPFVITVGSLLLLGLLGYLTFLLTKCIRTHCLPKPKADKKPLESGLLINVSLHPPQMVACGQKVGLRKLKDGRCTSKIFMRDTVCIDQGVGKVLKPKSRLPAFFYIAKSHKTVYIDYQLPPIPRMG